MSGWGGEKYLVSVITVKAITSNIQVALHMSSHKYVLAHTKYTAFACNKQYMDRVEKNLIVIF